MTDYTRMFAGLGDKFTEPRPQQTRILDDLLAGFQRVNVLEAPTGIGKSTSTTVTSPVSPSW